MATSKKSSKKSTAKKGTETTGRKKKTTGGDPIIITGGSIYVTFNPAFDDEATTKIAPKKKVKKVKAPTSSMTITGVVITDEKGNPLSSYTLPTDLNGKCVIYIKAQ